MSSSRDAAARLAAAPRFPLTSGWLARKCSLKGRENGLIQPITVAVSKIPILTALSESHVTWSMQTPLVGASGRSKH